MFFISYEDYLNYYRSTTICKFQENYTLSTLKLKHTRNSYCLAEVALKQRSRIFIRATQINPRMIPPASKYEVSNVKLLLARVAGDLEDPQMDYVQGVVGESAEVVLEPSGKLDPGSYLVFVEVDWK